MAGRMKPQPHGLVAGPSPRACYADLPDSALLDARQVADWLHVHPRQLRRWHVPHLQLGPRVRRYEAGAVRAWLAAHRRGAA